MAKGFGEYSGVQHTPHALSWLIKQHERVSGARALVDAGPETPTQIPTGTAFQARPRHTSINQSVSECQQDLVAVLPDLPLASKVARTISSQPTDTLNAIDRRQRLRMQIRDCASSFEQSRARVDIGPYWLRRSI
jgi:hypothetical protein